MEERGKRDIDIVVDIDIDIVDNDNRDEDNSGCTYHPDQNGWAQIMDKSGLAEPTCTEINKDPKRQRVCACQGTTF